MIIDILGGIGIAIIYLICFLFNQISYVFPTQFYDAISYFITGANQLKGIFPIQTLFTAFTSLLYFWTLWYTIKLIMWIISFVPGINHKKLPKEKGK